MPLYTFIMEFAGGTYISQVRASSPKSACLKWAKELKPEEVAGLGQSSKLGLVEEIREEKPVPIKGVPSVWCVFAHIRGRQALINIVQTEDLTV